MTSSQSFIYCQNTGLVFSSSLPTIPDFALPTTSPLANSATAEAYISMPYAFLLKQNNNFLAALVISTLTSKNLLDDTIPHDFIRENKILSMASPVTLISMAKSLVSITELSTPPLYSISFVELNTPSTLSYNELIETSLLSYIKLLGNPKASLTDDNDDYAPVSTEDMQLLAIKKTKSLDSSATKAFTLALLDNMMTLGLSDLGSSKLYKAIQALTTDSMISKASNDVKNRILQAIKEAPAKFSLSTTETDALTRVSNIITRSLSKVEQSASLSALLAQPKVADTNKSTTAISLSSTTNADNAMPDASTATVKLSLSQILANRRAQNATTK